MSTTRQERRVDWRELVEEQVRSGQGVRAFCRDRGLSASGFYTWKEQLGYNESKRVEVAAPVKFLEVKLAVTTPPIPASIASDAVMDTSSPLITASELSYAPAALIELRLPHGRSLTVAPGFDAVHLQRLIAVLESVVDHAMALRSAS